MISNANAASAGPNIGEDEENFFQSDRDIFLSKERKIKQLSYAEKGKPVVLASKILHFELHGNIGYVAQSGFITQKIDLAV